MGHWFPCNVCDLIAGTPMRRGVSRKQSAGAIDVVRELFPSWRDRWSEAPDIARLLGQADELLRQREKGNKRLPTIGAVDRENLSLCVVALKK